MDLNKKQIILLVFIVCLILTGGGIIVWQKANNRDIITNFEEVPPSVKETVSSVKDGKELKDEQSTEKKKITIHIAGAVKEAGVYELKEGARVIDALKIAGGEIEEAELDKINLAAPIFDSEKIFIPYENSDISNNEAGQKQNDIQKPELQNSTQSRSLSAKINLNQAERIELEQLPGIGPSKAASIIKYRDKIGSFTAFEQLLNVKGIGEKTLDKIVTELTLR